MYLGKIVEIAGKRSLYDDPMHPYTRALLSAIPVPVINQEKKRQVLQGEVPSPINKPKGCAFHTRCPHCMDICREVEPGLVPNAKDPEHMCACHLYAQQKEEA